MSWFSLSTIRVPGIEFQLCSRHNLLCDRELLRPELQSTTGWNWRWGEQGKLFPSFLELQTTGYCTGDPACLGNHTSGVPPFRYFIELCGLKLGVLFSGHNSFSWHRLGVWSD